MATEFLLIIPVKLLPILDKKIPQPKLRYFNLTLAVPTFPGRNQPSIISVVDLTSVFGMGTGVTLQLYPPGNFL